jgi:predicted metalloprotease with PDZ domain
VWLEWAERLLQGQPRAGDRGLDETRSWARTYWGGALFCFVADVTIRERTNNRFGLRHALRAIVREGGTLGKTWPLSRAFEVGDRATGTDVLSELYRRMRAEPVRIDLDAWWKRLGVRVEGPVVRFDDGAPLAHVRRVLIVGD